MIIERRKNAKRNIVFGIIQRIYNMVLPFAMRTAMIYLMGVEYLGLNSLFTSILQVLNLAELGVGSAMVFSMYKPIAEDDDTEICALLRLYRLYYRIIGAVVLGAGLIILPFVPRLIHGNIPGDVDVYVLYMLNLLATVFSYWLFAYRNSLLNAYQRTDVVSKISMITSSIQYVLQFAVLALFHNYYYYVIIIITIQIVNNVVTAIVTKRMYPQYDPKGQLPREAINDINNRVKDVFTSKLGGTILNSADTIVISSFLGLTSLAIYQNYYYIMSAVMAVFGIFFSSIVAGVGNSMVTDSREKNYRDYKKFSMVTFDLMGICTAEMLSLYQPFMKIWVGEELMLSNGIVILFCIYFVFVEYVQLAAVYKDAAGIWHEDRFRPLASGLANLTMNLAMVHTLGLYGIILSTILSAGLISTPWITHNLFTLIFKGNFKDYMPMLIKHGGMIVVITVVSYLGSALVPASNLILLVVRAIIVLIISIVLLWVAEHRAPECQDILNLIIPKKLRRR